MLASGQSPLKNQAHEPIATPPPSDVSSGTNAAAFSDTPSSPPQEPNMQAPMQPEPPSAIPSEPSVKTPDQSSEAPKVTTPDKSAENTGSMQSKSSGQFLNEQKTDEMLASTIIGQSTDNSQNENIGEINDLATDQSGKIVAALIGVGGFLGMGEKDVAVSVEDLKLAPDENNNVKIVLNLNKETLASAPDYKKLDEEVVVEGSAKPEDTNKPEDTKKTY
jgi:hypothetical protein